MIIFIGLVLLYLIGTALCFSSMLYDWYFIHNFEITSSDLKMMMAISMVPFINMVFAFLVFFGTSNAIVLKRRNPYPSEE